MTKPSCLNCAFGKPEKQEQGYYCSKRVEKGYGSPFWKTHDCGTDCDCSTFHFYKPRQNQCQIDGCKWMVEGDCESPRDRTSLTIAPNPHFTGKECYFFEKQEEDTMETIKVNGQTYEADIALTFYGLFVDARDCSDATVAIWKFSQQFHDIGYYDRITLTKRVVAYLNQHPGIIPWLVEKGYLREVVEEETYKEGQCFFLQGQTDCIYTISNEIKPVKYMVLFYDLKERAIKVCDNGNLKTLREATNYIRRCNPIKTDPPLITEQPDTAERRPELCVHNSNHRCSHGPALKLFTMPGTVMMCSTNHYKTCSEYTPK